MSTSWRTIMNVLLFHVLGRGNRPPKVVGGGGTDREKMFWGEGEQAAQKIFEGGGRKDRAKYFESISKQVLESFGGHERLFQSPTTYIHLANYACKVNVWNKRITCQVAYLSLANDHSYTKWWNANDKYATSLIFMRPHTWSDCRCWIADFCTFFWSSWVCEINV